ncbi:hypothetical protein GCM10010472_10950 [Pseudonocardia halophobica]|uniref:DNA primase/polymerase bifunctional N-terminal domain-containing protein n=1 Tax=Pseudonocardia halophobica TaxID=29401 RepID=A0A9W6NYH1_9PSEU|nr:bifunctional DNA primase/polymerase [Pseudonocardia halophobica]GLL13482.1 hypothetical protein GCM10017577_46260 [Pseudonocardia halophobica]
MTEPIYSWHILAELAGGQGLDGCAICGVSSITHWRSRGLHERCVPAMVERLAPSVGWAFVGAQTPAAGPAVEKGLSTVETLDSNEGAPVDTSGVPADVLGCIQSGASVLPLHWRTDEGTCSCGADCGNNAAKHPLTRNGKDDATTDPAIVVEWAARWPRCNWGIRPPEGVVVVDVDPRNGGHETLARLQDEHGALPRTLTARTGGGGVHLWLTMHGPSRGRLGQGVDIKRNSGYLVAPPSVHITGGRYEWVDRRPSAVAPAWLRSLLDPTPPRPRNAPTTGDLAPLVKFVSAAQEGERNRSLYWAMCRAAEAGHDLAPLIDAGIGIGLTPHEAHAAARSAQRTAAA